MKKIKHHYTESGLNNVHIDGLVVKDDIDEECIIIPAINELHELISSSLIQKEYKLNEEEIYFLRGEMGLNVAALKKRLQLDAQSDDMLELLKNQKNEIAFRRLAEHTLVSDTAKHVWAEEKQISAKVLSTEKCTADINIRTQKTSRRKRSMESAAA